MTKPQTNLAAAPNSAVAAGRILPIICALYILNFLDRVNVSYAAIDMTKALGFTSTTYGFGAGIFFVGYLVLEIPISLAIERGNAHRWLFAMALTWGLVAGLTGFIHTPLQFYAARFALGLAEAGCFPGLIIYLNRWSTPDNHARVLAYMVTGLPLANLIAAPLSSLLLRVHWFGLEGWRWLFIVEAVPTVALAFLILARLPDHPSAGSHSDGRSTRIPLSESPSWRVLTDSRVLALAAAWFFFNVAVYGFTFWLPLLLKRSSHLSSQASALLSALPFAVALTATILVSKSSDRHRERYWHAAIPMAIFGGFLCISVLVVNRSLLAFAMLCCAGLGINSGTASFLAIASGVFHGRARALAIGMLTSFGALGGFIGPYLMGALNASHQSFNNGVFFLGCAGVTASLFVIIKRYLFMKHVDLYQS